MKKILDLISEEVVKAFEEAGYSADFAKVTLSNRPDLCEYQCNGALAAAKTYKKAPIMIANDVVAKLKENGIFQEVQAVSPGFINLKLSGDYLAEYLKQMQADENHVIKAYFYYKLKETYTVRVADVYDGKTFWRDDTTAVSKFPSAVCHDPTPVAFLCPGQS